MNWDLVSDNLSYVLDFVQNNYHVQVRTREIILVTYAGHRYSDRENK
jgi:hypothetical protein